MSKHSLWLVYALVTTAAWGAWGALIQAPTNAGFPETLGYVVWALTMIPPAIVAMFLAGWKLETDSRSIVIGSAAGFLGAGGQLILFKTVPPAPAYLVFPFIALSPLVTIVMALVISREKAKVLGWIGIILALVAGVFLYMEPAGKDSVESVRWVFKAFLVLLAWGIQGFVISHGNKSMKAESIFFYMAATALVLAPFAIWMTDFDKPITWGFKGPYAAALIHSLNSVGALLLVYAYRYGKAIIISPLINAGAPALTTVISLLSADEKPYYAKQIGMVLAIIATVLMALEEEQEAEEENTSELAEAEAE